MIYFAIYFLKYRFSRLSRAASMQPGSAAMMSASVSSPPTSSSDTESHDGDDTSRLRSGSGTDGKETNTSVASFEHEVDEYTNHDIIERCFADCDLQGEGRLHYQEFKMWVNRNPSILSYFEELLPYSGN